MELLTIKLDEVVLETLEWSTSRPLLDKKTSTFGLDLVEEKDDESRE